MTWAATGAAAIGVAGSVGQGMMNKKAAKEGAKNSQQLIMTPQQKQMLRQMTGINSMVLAGGQTPGDIAAANAAQTEGQLALRDAVAQQEVMPGSSAMTPEMLAMLQAKALQGRVAGNVQTRNASYDAARQAGLQIALGSQPKGQTSTRTGSGYGAMSEALNGVAKGIGLAIPTTEKEGLAGTENYGNRVAPTIVDPGPAAQQQANSDIQNNQTNPYLRLIKPGW
jgi:hypothetical protein